MSLAPDGTTSPAYAAEQVVRSEYPRILATLIRVTGDVDLAEDAVQEAVLRALQTWPRDGVPDEPRAWLTVVARRCAIDRIRRDVARDRKEGEAMGLLDDDGGDRRGAAGDAAGDDGRRDVVPQSRVDRADGREHR